MINFKEFVDLMCKMCKADYTQKLKLLYELHQPPSLLETDDMDEETIASPKSGKFISLYLARTKSDYFCQQYKAWPAITSMQSDQAL